MDKGFSVIIITNDETRIADTLYLLKNQGQPFELFVITENLSLRNFGRSEITIVECQFPFCGDQVFSCLGASINDYIILNYGDIGILSKQIQDCNTLAEEGLVYGEAPKVDASYFSRNTIRYFLTRDIHPKSKEHKILPFILTRKFVNYLLKSSPLIWWNTLIDPSNNGAIKFKPIASTVNHAYVKHFGFILLLLSTDLPRKYLQRVNQVFFVLLLVVLCASIISILTGDLPRPFMLLVMIGNFILWIVLAIFFLLTTLVRILEISLISSLGYSSRSILRFRK